MGELWPEVTVLCVGEDGPPMFLGVPLKSVTEPSAVGPAIKIVLTLALGIDLTSLVYTNEMKIEFKKE